MGFWMEFLQTFSTFSLFQIILLAIFGALWLVRMLFLFVVTAQIIWKRKAKKHTDESGPISVLFSFRNEEENVKRLLPKLLEIPNEHLELIAVDDFSQDNSLSLLGLYRQRYSRLKISSLSQETQFSEKLAQNIGLKSAKNRWVLLAPLTMEVPEPYWIESFQKSATDEGNLIVAYSNVLPQSTWFNHLLRAELFFQFVRSVGYIANGAGWIYTEQNIAFTKEEYFRIGGYGQNIKEPYANLELLINSYIRKAHTKIETDPKAKMLLLGENTKAAFKNVLRKAWRIESHLPVWKQFLLSFDNITKMLFIPLLGLVLFVDFPLWPVIAAFAILLLLTRMLIIKITLNRLNERKIFITSLAYDLIMPYYKVFARWHFRGTKRRHKWKNKV